MRYTKFNNKIGCMILPIDDQEFVFGEHINKLGQLEDIEEELGIDLITLFKALKNGVYIKDKNKKCKSCYLSACFGSMELTKAGIRYSTISIKKYLYFKDYGKTWALTKEELENE